MKNRKESVKQIKAAFKKLAGCEINISPSNTTYDHVIMVSMGSETPEQAAQAILNSAKVA